MSAPRSLARAASDLLGFFRLRPDGAQVPCYRALVYTALGSAVAGRWAPMLLLANAAAVGLLFMFLGAYDNYWDWRLRGEANATGAALTRWRLPRAGGLALAAAPWALLIPVLGAANACGLSLGAERALWLLAGLGLVHATPGVRLKERPFNFFLAPAWAALLFWQGWAVTGTAGWSASLGVLCGAVFLLQCHAELMHRVADRVQAGLSDAPLHRLLTWFRWLPGISVLLSAAAATVNALFLNTTVWSLVRLQAVRGLAPERVGAIRQRVWHPAWSLYEVGIYGLVGWLRPWS